MNIFFDLISNLLYIISFLFIIASFLQIKLIWHRRYLAALLIPILFATGVIGSMDEAILPGILYVIEFALLLMILGEMRLPEALGYSLGGMAFLALLCFIPDEFLTILRKQGGITLSLRACGTIEIFLSLLFLLLLRIRYRRYQHLNLITALLNHWAIALAAGLADIFIITFVNFLLEDGGHSSGFYILYAILITLGCYVQLGVLFEMINASDSEHREKKQLEANIRMQDENYRYQQERNKKTRQFRHDIRNHMSLLQQLIAQKKYAEAEEYLTEMNGVVEQFGSYITLNNGIAEISVNQFIHEAERRGIRVQASGRFPDVCFLPIITITTIFNNLLSNALEAAEKYGGDVQLYVRYSGDHIMISVTNRCDPALEMESGMPATTKKDRKNHGLGLQNVSECVRQNGGEMLIQAHDGEFNVLIDLKNQNVKEIQGGHSSRR